MHDQHIQRIAEVTSVSTIFAVLGGWLPPIATLLAITWYLLMIWESPTVRGWLGKPPVPTLVEKDKKDDRPRR